MLPRPPRRARVRPSAERTGNFARAWRVVSVGGTVLAFEASRGRAFCLATRRLRARRVVERPASDCVERARKQISAIGCVSESISHARKSAGRVARCIGARIGHVLSSSRRTRTWRVSMFHASLRPTATKGWKDQRRALAWFACLLDIFELATDRRLRCRCRAKAIA